MNQSGALWAVAGFCAALLMGAAAGPADTAGRWQLMTGDEPTAKGLDVAAVLFDTATGTVLVLPRPEEVAEMSPIYTKMRGSWTPLGPMR